MIIQCKSNPENFEKEKSGNKANTIRTLDGSDVIQISNSVTGETIKRQISDISVWKGTIIISFVPEKQ